MNISELWQVKLLYVWSLLFCRSVVLIFSFLFGKFQTFSFPHIFVQCASFPLSSSTSFIWPPLGPTARSKGIPVWHPSSKLSGWLHMSVSISPQSDSSPSSSSSSSSSESQSSSSEVSRVGVWDYAIWTGNLYGRLISRGGRPSMGGWDKHKGERETSTRGETRGRQHVVYTQQYAFMHRTLINHTCAHVRKLQTWRDKGQRVGIWQE